MHSLIQTLEGIGRILDLYAKPRLRLVFAKLSPIVPPPPRV